MDGVTDADLDGPHRLATYGTLSPGRSNHHHVAELRGTWFPGHVHGHLIEEGWGAGLGYPALILDPEAAAVPVQVLDSPDLPAHWDRLDDFEGAEYERVVATVHTDTGHVPAFLYALRSG